MCLILGPVMKDQKLPGTGFSHGDQKYISTRADMHDISEDLVPELAYYPILTLYIGQKQVI